MKRIDSMLNTVDNFLTSIGFVEIGVADNIKKFRDSYDNLVTYVYHGYDPADPFDDSYIIFSLQSCKNENVADKILSFKESQISFSVFYV